VTAANEEPTPPRLNPFALPSDTSFRFLLLIVSIVGFTLFAFGWIHIKLADNERDAGILLSCTRNEPTALEALAHPDTGGSTVSAYLDCVAPVYRPRGVFMLGGVALLGATAGCLYLGAYRARRRRFRGLSDDDVPGLAGEVAALATATGLAHPPRLVWNPLDRTASGVAFGPPWRRTIAITGGLVVRFASDRRSFRAIVLHELAHLRNRDVDVAFLTVAVWRAFLIVVLVPLLISLATLALEAPATVAALAWRLGLLALLVYLTRNAVLRVREHHADIRASIHEPAIRDVLAASAKPTGREPPAALRMHPPSADRVAAVDDPSRVLHLGLLEAFAVGVTGSLAFEEVTSLLFMFGVTGIGSQWAAAAVFAPIVAGVIATGVWRQAFAALARGFRPAPVALIGVALGAGLLVGRDIGISAGVIGGPFSAGVAATIDPATTAVAVIATIGLVAWISAGACLWLPAVAGMRSAWPAAIAAIVAAAAVLVVGLGIYALVTNVPEAPALSSALTSAQQVQIASVVWTGPALVYDAVMDPFVQVLATHPLVMTLVVTVWAFPLAASVWARGLPSAPIARWASLDPSSRPLRLTRTPTNVRRAIGAGLVAGACIAIVFIALRLLVRATLPDTTRATDEFALAFFYWSIVVALLGQGVIAAVVALRTTGAPVLHGLLAAFVTGIAAALALVALSPAASCVPVLAIRPAAPACGWLPEPSFVLLTVEQVVVEGALVALVAGVAAAATTGLLRQSRPRARAAAIARS
jgi:Peptidase family M48